MSKFVIECPKCGKYAEAKKGFWIFGKKKIDCSCGNVIDVRADKLSSRVCSHCGNNVVFDQSKGAKAKCPVCHEPINTMAEQTKMVEFSCAQCGIRLQTAKGADTYTCPVCDCVNDVAERLVNEKIKHDGLASIIKYEGDNSTFVWKHPIEDFNYGSQLIVHESQEAVFFRDGQALDTFGPGRYTLETQQLPLLEKVYKLPTDNESTFHSEVYFINKTVQMAIKWGTPDKVRFIDPLTGTPLELGASGEMNLAVEDGRKLLIKLVGTMKGISWEEGPGFTKSLQASFRPLISNAVKTNLPAAIRQNEIDVLEIDEKLDVISAALMEKIQPGFAEYGLTIPQFYVNNIVLPENDPNFKRIRELHTVVLQSKVYQAEAAVLTAKAASEAQYRTAQEKSKAEIEAAHRGAVIQEELTKTEQARREAERKVIGAQATAEKTRVEGKAEAEVMAAKGYSQKDVLQTEVQKAYAEGIGNMGPKSVSGGSGGGSVFSDIMSLGIGIKAMDAVMPQLGGMFQGMQPQQPDAPASAPAEGMRDGPGSTAPSPAWDCPACGCKNITSKFCPDCGAKKPEPKPADVWDCPACGKKGITSKFCPDCGTKKPEAPTGWNCPDCGATDLTSRFCPYCGAKKPEETWTCPACGATGIKTKFCPECGNRREN